MTDWTLFVLLPIVIMVTGSGLVILWMVNGSIARLQAADVEVDKRINTLGNTAKRNNDEFIECRRRVDEDIIVLQQKIEDLEKSYAADPRRLEIKAEEEAQKTKPTGFMTFSQRKRAAEAALRKKPKA